jgi:ferredoxin-NADP reductase
MIWQKAIVVDVVSRTPRIKSFFFSLPQPIAFIAGQYMDVRLVAPDGYEARRSYSIASAPEQPVPLELAVERLEGGEVSTFLHDEVRPRDEVELRGPIGGHFIWSVRDGGPVLTVGGGSGVVPLISMIRHHAARRSDQRLTLVASARTPAELLYRQELQQLHRQDGAFSFLGTVTRHTAVPAGLHAGRIDRAMLSAALQSLGGRPKLSFVCGNNGFVEAITAILLELQVPPGQIRTERYGG